MSPARHADVLEQPENLRMPLAGSLVLHAGVGALALFWGVVLSHSEHWGDPNAGGGVGSVTINVVNKVPLPARSGLVNPLANDSQFTVPSPPPKAKPAEKAPEPEPDAIPIKSRRVPPRPSPREYSRETYRNPAQQRPNQMYSNVGQALVSPMIGQTGGGGVGLGPMSTPFGNRYGNYVAILRQKVAQSWHTADVDPRLKAAPPVIVDFTIMRDGSVRGVSVAQRSGNSALDYSAERAIYDASPFPALPADFSGGSVQIEFWFELKR